MSLIISGKCAFIRWSGYSFVCVCVTVRAEDEQQHKRMKNNDDKIMFDVNEFQIVEKIKSLFDSIANVSHFRSADQSRCDRDWSCSFRSSMIASIKMNGAKKKTNEQKINILMVGFADEDENGSQKIICLSIDRKTLLTFSEQTYDCTKKEIEIIWSVFTLLRSNDENVLTKNHHKKKILNRNEACILLVWMCIGHSMRWKSKDQNQKRWEATKRLKARARKNCTRNQFSMR